MIKFQKDHTTPEQSKLLLDLGVPADSANLAYSAVYFKNFDESGSRSGWKPTPSFNYIAIPDWSKHTHYPCWSALRLMEIIDICALGENSDPNTEEYPSTIKVMNKLHIPYVEYLVKSIERAVQLGTIDFSKLEIQ